MRPSISICGLKTALCASLLALVASACGREAKTERPHEDASPLPSPGPSERQPSSTGSQSSEGTHAEGNPSTVATPVFAFIDGQLSEQGAFRVRIVKWSAGPQVTSGESRRNSLELEFATPEGLAPASLEVFELVPFMKVHGHGVPRAYLPTWKVDGHRVQVQNLGFVMAGPWELKLRARCNGREDRIEIPIEVP